MERTAVEKYIKSINALNELTLSVKNPGEIDRYAESDIFWAASRKRNVQNRRVRKGEVYQFEFGKNFVPEMSYEHRGLVIGVSRKLLYVLPICSYNAQLQDHKNAIHPVDNPNGSSDYFLLKAVDFSFLTHDSVLKLNDLRTVSVSRIKYKQTSGYIDPSSDTYKAIEYHAFSRHFPEYSYQYNQIKQQNEKIREDNSSLQAKLEAVKKMLEEHDTDGVCKEILQEIFAAEQAADSSGSAKAPEKD